MENNVNEESLLRSFIGNNYDKITKRPFNVAGFFFSSFYMLYRKMYLYGILTLLGQIAISVVFSSNTYISLIINILVGIFVNKIYIAYAKNQINKIKQNSNGEDVTKLCLQKGGTSAIGILLGIGISVLVYTVLVFALGVSYFSQFMTLTTNIDSTDNIVDDSDFVDDYVPGVYSGELRFDSDVVMANEFSISVPDVFTDNSYDEQYNYEYQVGEEIFNSCRFWMVPVQDFTSSEDLISQMVNYHEKDNPTALKKETINGINWSSFSYTDDIGKSYYYALDKNGKVYVLNYEVQVDTDSNCETYRQEILNSIKEK